MIFHVKEPDIGWRVFDRAGYVINFGPPVICQAAFDIETQLGLKPGSVPLIGQERDG